MSNIYYWEKLTFSKLVGKVNFSERKFEENVSFQKGTRYIRWNVYFGIIVFSCLSSTKPCLRFLLICFTREIKGFYQNSLGNEVGFTNIMNVFLKYLRWKLKFQKAETRFCRWESNDYNSDVNNGRSSDMSDSFYVAVGHLKIEI